MSIEALLKTNVNEHTEKKANLTYLSWAWAWAEALKADPKATFKVEMFDGKCYMEINGTAMVWVTVTMFDKPMTCQLPVMDSGNKAIPLKGYTAVSKYGKEYRVECDAFAVNTAIMRCMTKALGLHGLGLYIYAGQDLPDEDDVTHLEDRRKRVEVTRRVDRRLRICRLVGVDGGCIASLAGSDRVPTSCAKSHRLFLLKLREW